MSHIVKIAVQMKNQRSVVRACQKLKLVCEENAEGVFYNGTKVTGTKITMPGWRYPAVVEESGEIATDTYGSAWGNLDDLNPLKQRYSIEEAQATLGAQGIYAYETMDELTGAITLEATVN